MLQQLRPSKFDSHGMRTAKQKARSAIKRVYQKELLENQTGAELRLWEVLQERQLGEKFTQQAIIIGFIVDFWCGRLRLAIEVDGPIHLERREYDRRRDAALSKSHVTVLRFTNAEVFENRPTCLNRIRAEIERLSATPAAKRRTTIMLKSAKKKNKRAQ